ncbi:MAG TPA: hypothetical protein VI819_03280 [Patescibacteria group bacterium]|nr:hypothetical protein [Patescibacteria group bacterium]
MKKIFSGVLLVFTFPFRLLKKTKIDNFIGGLIFGAVFSLIVNIVTVSIQENVQKQRMLEALENEIVMNMIQANSIIKQNNTYVKEGTTVNLLYSPFRYSSDVWTQSSEPVSYIAQLDQTTQIKVITYYLNTIKYANSNIDITEDFFKKAKSYCFDENLILLPENKESCELWSRLAYQSETSAAEGMSDSSFGVLQQFHPTKDRLNNWFLRLIMGTKSTRILSGE